MNATIPTLLIVATVAFTPQSAAQKTNQPKEPVASSRVPVDVSLQGLGEVSGLALGDAARGGSVAVTPSVGSVSPLAFSCIPSIRDQATGGCLQASSTPTPGLLFPPPHGGGFNNVSSGQHSFVGGGENNQATGLRCTVGGGRGNMASGPFGATVGGGGKNTASGYYATVGGGRNNTASDVGATVGGGRSNSAPACYATVGGGVQNEASRRGASVGGGESNSASGFWSAVGGGNGNTAPAPRSTIGGGTDNYAFGYHATIGGGRQNTTSGIRATIGGGSYNTAFTNATVGGGGNNTASGGLATIGGGGSNTASGTSSTVGGGHENTASEYWSTVPGGFRNDAMGYFSFAAGRHAKANHDGSFVWGDSNNVNKLSSAPDEFNVYASGGARFFTNSAATTGVLLAPGGGSWSAVSDRDSKENVELVDGRAILERLVAMPLSTWNYKAQDDSIRHMGPMAQDFRAAFGLGVSDKLIDTIDPDGVALAAIQGLHALVQEKDAEIADLRKRLERLEASLTVE